MNKLLKWMGVPVVAGGLLWVASVTTGAAPWQPQAADDNGVADFDLAVSVLNSPEKNIASLGFDLRKSISAGHVPAVFLLWDVYEGRFMGLEAQESAGIILARDLASGKIKCGVSPKLQEEVKLEAMFRMGIYSEYGFGCTPNYRDAYAWMVNAAAGGLGRARVELARYLINGVGCAPEPRKGVNLLLMQQKEDDSVPNLYFYLGYAYLYGVGVPEVDRAKAFSYFEQGVDLGDPRAANSLGAMYEHGVYVSRNLDKALHYYKLAAAGGNKEASVNLHRVASRMEVNSVKAAARVDSVGMRILWNLPLPHSAKVSLTRFLHGEDSKD